MKIPVLWILLSSLCYKAIAQRDSKDHLIYIDANGIMRYTTNHEEASFFGVNYTIPFAYGYRSHKKLGIDHEKAIDADVYHMYRLGLNAFRVHMWDTEISDSTGNLLHNEHLRLFDYLIMRLKEYGIKTMLTPIAFWGNGYPDPDEKTPGFSARYNKQKVLREEVAIAAQEKYLRQLLDHINFYTGLKYMDDPDIIALEINNEPHHSGTIADAKDYIDRMVSVVKKAGWNKPVYYNISESPRYALAAATADVQGVSFQWYPTGLVANKSLQGNMLPHVDRYLIPFDTIPAYRNKSLMVYEFDAGDVMSSYMYPAMARSFREAGFQWATQFAYDPLHTAQYNTEYQTHYLNLVYTPAKAISLMIAGKAFQQLPLRKSYGRYPQNNSFGPFKVDSYEDISTMNTAEEYYHSNHTEMEPVDPSRIKRIAGVGSSPIVTYQGNGAYFLDKINENLWRLEVYPDVEFETDPFGRAALNREVISLFFTDNYFQFKLPGFTFNTAMRIAPDNRIFRKTEHITTIKNNTFRPEPGVYLLSSIGNVEVKPELKKYFAPTTIQKQTMMSVGIPADEVILSEITFTDWRRYNVYNPDWRRIRFQPQTSNGPATFTLQDSSAQKFGIEFMVPYVATLNDFKNLAVSVTAEREVKFKIHLTDRDANSISHSLTTKNTGIQNLNLKSFVPDSMLLLPRGYPSFQSTWFKPSKGAFELKKLERIQLIFENPDMKKNEIRIAGLTFQ